MRRRLLIVDDERALLAAMTRYFTRMGFDVHSTREMEEAAALLKKYEYEVALVDLHLTPVRGTEGLEVLRVIRELRPKTKPIVLTAYGSSEVENEARHLGALRVLAKPTALPELAKLVSELVDEEAI